MPEAFYIELSKMDPHACHVTAQGLISNQSSAFDIAFGGTGGTTGLCIPSKERQYDSSIVKYFNIARLYFLM